MESTVVSPFKLEHVLFHRPSDGQSRRRETEHADYRRLFISRVPCTIFIFPEREGMRALKRLSI